MKINHTRADRVFIACDYVFATLALLVCAYPLWFVLIASFSDPTLVSTGQVWIWPKGFTVQGYKTMFETADVWTGYRNTIVYTALGTALALSLTVPAGYALSRKTVPGRKALYWVFLLCIFVNGGLVPTYLLINGLGLSNTVWVMIILGGVSVWNLTICRTFFESNLPDELLEAAQIDGSDDITFFFRVALPLSKSLLAVMTLFYAVGYWNNYFNALIYLRDKRLYSLQLVLRNILMSAQGGAQSSMHTEMGTEYIIGMLTMKYGIIIVASLPVLIAYPFVQKFFIKGVMIGAIKG